MAVRASGADKRISIGTLLIIPPQVLAKVVVRTVFVSSCVVGFSMAPQDQVQRGPVRPHPRPLLLGVAQSDPGEFLTGVKSLDESCDIVVFLLTVDRHQVGALGPAVQLGVGPAHLRGHVLVAAAVEAEPERGAVASLQLDLSIT